MFNIDLHRFNLVQILKDIYSDIAISSLLGFKGGTACHLLYNLPRFSVDLDFDLLDEKRAPIVFKKIENILKNYGQIKEKSDKRQTLFFVLSYEEMARNIKVEISKRNFGSGYEVKNYLGIPLLVMKKEDILAHKLVALLERRKQANRDLFDLWFMLKKNWEVDEEIIKTRTKMSLKKYLKKCLQFVEKVNNKHILVGMGELLDEKTKVWAKQHLKEDLLFLIRLRLK